MRGKGIIMKKILLLVTGMMMAGCASVQTVKPEMLKFPELRTVTAPHYSREKLDNGMIVFLMEDRSLPLVRFQALIRTGSIYEPAEKTGLADMTLETLRTGGAGKISGDEIDSALENIGASISAGTDWDVASVGGLSYKKNFLMVFDIFRSMLTEPSFSQDKIDLCVIGKKGAISRRNDDISDLADREFRRLVYGGESPYARTEEYETIDNVSREDIVNFHRKYFHPENVILGIWGDFSTPEMLKTVREEFGSWKSGGIIRIGLPPVEFPPATSTNLIVRKDATQSVIIMGHAGIRRDHPDYAAAVILSRILGAGWYSRFSKSLRQEKGLAYDIWASFIPEYDYPGLFIAKSQTRQEKTSETVGLMKEEIASMKQGVTDQELSAAKEGILNSEVFWSDTKDKIITRLMRYEYYGYPFDYPEKLIDGVKKVTKEDVVRVAKELLFPENLTLLVVGNPDKFDSPLPSGTRIIKLNP